MLSDRWVIVTIYAQLVFGRFQKPFPYKCFTYSSQHPGRYFHCSQFKHGERAQKVEVTHLKPYSWGVALESCSRFLLALTDRSSQEGGESPWLSTSQIQSGWSSIGSPSSQPGWPGFKTPLCPLNPYMALGDFLVLGPSTLIWEQNEGNNIVISTLWTNMGICWEKTVVLSLGSVVCRSQKVVRPVAHNS